MTQPVGHGYPDYGRFRASADKIYLFHAATVITEATVLPRIFVGDVPFVFFSFGPDVSNFQILFHFYDAETGGNFFAGQAFSVRLGSQIAITIPTSGPWLQISLNAQVYNASYTLRVGSAHVPFTGSSSDPTGNVLLQHAANIAAATTVTVNPIRVFPGEAYWSFRTNSTNWEMFLESHDWLGAVIRLDNKSGTTVTDDRSLIFLPPAGVRVRLQNIAAAAAFFHFALIARPIEPGR